MARCTESGEDFGSYLDARGPGVNPVIKGPRGKAKVADSLEKLIPVMVSGSVVKPKPEGNEVWEFAKLVHEDDLKSADQTIRTTRGRTQRSIAEGELD